MTNDEITKMTVDLTADILKLLIQEKIKQGWNSFLSSNPDYNHEKVELVRAANKYANSIINTIIFPK